MVGRLTTPNKNPSSGREEDLNPGLQITREVPSRFGWSYAVKEI